MNALTLHRIALPFLALGLLTACSPDSSSEKEAPEWKRGLFQRMQNNLSEPVAARVQTMPPDLLQVLQHEDLAAGMKHADRYAARAATPAELALLSSYIALLPRSYQTVFAQKLLAVYLIDGFSGAGMTDWVADRDGQTYYFIVFNSALFSASLDDWLSYKENSYFDNSAASPAVRVRTGTAYRALMYGLLHEGAHIVDYELGIAPYVDAPHRRLKGRTQETSAFTEGVWRQQKQPVARYDFKHRGEINPYGEFAGKGLIPRAELPEMFAQLTQTPFVSFYSGTSWNEDLADYMTYRLIEQALGGAVTVELLGGGTTIARYQPLSAPQSPQREQAVRALYD